MLERHPVEALDSWETYLERFGQEGEQSDGESAQGDDPSSRRFLKKKFHNHADDTPEMLRLERQKEDEYWENEKLRSEVSDKEMKKRKKYAKHHRKKMKKLYNNPGIAEDTVHGLMIDAGSTGSRMHLYEWKPRTLHNDHEVQEVVSGRTLSNPGTDSRWTARLRPGISTFADLPDDQIVEALAEYLEPLLDFSKHVLASKRDRFDTFPIYLRATAGMRTLTTSDRARVMNGVRTLFSNTTYSPFYFQEEQARVISGEEEAIFGWAGVNFLLGTLIDDSQGAGVVVKPRLTYGALDLGGASTQISFYQPDQDIMSNLFKLQIGQGKHWNLYSHSFLEYGIEAATNRFEARLIDGMDTTERLVDGVHNPCLPGGASKHIRNNIHVDADNVETWDYDKSSVSGSYQNAILKNAHTGGDYETCSTFVKALLHQDKNDWCEFSHRGDCSFAGVYQPELPLQSKHFGEFLAFSNFYHVWDFLQLPSRSTLSALDNATRTVCSMSETEVHDYAGDQFYAPAMINDMCFRSTYAFQLLRNGYGFKMDDSITATNVIGGQKVGWTLGAIMYEINTLPWHYVTRTETKVVMDPFLGTSIFFAALVFGMLFALGSIFRSRRASQRYQYESIKQ